MKDEDNILARIIWNETPLIVIPRTITLNNSGALRNNTLS